ncbi:MAG TPA: hypothetical protein VGM88_20995 [Kofleriaceae bacterium]|jgi:hypothetical protein
MRIAWVAVLLVGCSSSAGHAYLDGPDDPGEGGVKCDRILASLDQEMMTRGGTCETAADCVIVGGGGDQCESGQTVLACGGVAIAQSSPNAATIQSLIQQAFDNGCTTEAGYDCAPSEASCSDSGICQTETHSCLEPMPDGPPDGIPDSFIPDASPATDAP